MTVIIAFSNFLNVEYSTVKYSTGDIVTTEAMNTTKSEVFNKLLHENCYSVVGDTPWFGWGIFGEGRWANFQLVGGPHPPSPIPPVGKTLIQGHKLIIVNDCVCMYDNVYCVAVENFNTGYSVCKIDLFDQGKPSIMVLQKDKSLKYNADEAANLIIHELVPEKWVFWLRRVKKTWYRCLVTSGFLLSRKVWWTVRIVNFWAKIEVFINQNGANEGPHKNKFWVVSNSEMNNTNSAEKVDKKIGSFV